MIDMFQNTDPATLARQFYSAAPNIDPTPLLAKLDTMGPGGSPGFGVPDANSAASMPGADYMTKLNTGNAGPGAANLGGGAPWGLISSGVGMMQQAHPQRQLPDFQVQYPGGQAAKLSLAMPGPVVPTATPPLSELFGRVRRG